jgi:hypothetical protein
LAEDAQLGQSLSVLIPPTTDTPPDQGPADLGAALCALREVVAAARFPLGQAEAKPARDAARALREQLDDYLIPRVSRLDAPVLAVVGGSTGAGKSTLVNSLVRAPVSQSGVLRPTTRGPVLVCHAADSAWFGGRDLLSGLTRGSVPAEGTLQIVSSPVLQPGLALLDAPDIDSVVTSNRELAAEVLAAADLWLFVTTAARYADAVPWEVLRGARDRGTVVAVVLDRVPLDVRDDLAADLRRLLSEQGLPTAELFVVEESTPDSQGLLPAEQVAPIVTFLTQLAASEVRRRAVTRHTLLGAVSAAATTAADVLATAGADQLGAATALIAVPEAAYRRATSTVEEQLDRGAVLRGDAYGKLLRSIDSGELGRLLAAAKDPGRARPSPSKDPGRGLRAAVLGSLSALLVEADTQAREVIADIWRRYPDGPALLGEPAWDTADAARELVAEWQGWLQSQVRQAAPSPRTPVRGTVTTATALLALLAAVAPPPPAVTGDGAVPATLRRVLSIPAVAGFGERARAELVARARVHLSGAAQRWVARVEALGVDSELDARLRQAAADVSVAKRLALVMGRAA